MVLGSSPVAVTSPSDFAPASSKEFLDIQATIECGFTLKRVRDMTRTYSQRQCKTGKTIRRRIQKPVYWNEYQTKIWTKNLDNNNSTRFPLDASFEGVKTLFVLVFNNTAVNVTNNPINNANNRVLRNSHQNYFLPRVNITNYNALIDGKNFYDQPPQMTSKQTITQQGVC